MPTPRIILLVGPGRCGKDTIGTYLKQHHGFARHAFAKPLYDAAMVLYGIEPMTLLAENKEAPITRLDRSLREIVQELGDHARATCGRDILIRRLRERATARGDWRQSDIVITDGRTEAEIDWARSEGASIWWVSRPSAPAVRDHATERTEALRIKLFLPYDFSITNTGTVEDLYLQVDRALFAMRNAVAA
jgi:hypothetical protein